MSSYGMIAGIVGGVLGSVQQALGDYEVAKALLEDATYYTEQATLARTSSILTINEARRKQEQSLGTGLANIGKSGVTFEGSAVNVITEQLRISELDINALRKRGDQEVAEFLRMTYKATDQAQWLLDNWRMRKAASYFNNGGSAGLPSGGTQEPTDNKMGPPNAGEEGSAPDWWGE